jgi:hypothetical protein
LGGGNRQELENETVSMDLMLFCVLFLKFDVFIVVYLLID